MKQEADLIVNGGMVITLDPSRRMIQSGAVAVKEDKIIAVGKSGKIRDQYTADKVIDAHGKVVLPGVSDSHVHMTSSLVKSLIYAEPIPLGLSYMPFNETLTSEDRTWAARLTCLERLKNGVATIIDVGSPDTGRMCSVIEESGMRGVVSFPMKDKTIPGFPYSRGLPEGVTTEGTVRKAKEFYRDCDGKADGRLRVSYATNIWSTSDDLYVETKKLADANGTSIHDHLDQHRHELEYSLRTWKKRPVEHLEDLGVLGPTFNAHHMVYVGDREIPILQRHDVKICHNPRAALNSHGLPKFPLFNALGLTCTMGTDMRIADMFEIMRLASYVHHGTWGITYYDPLVLPADNILEMVTLNPAKATGMEDTFGSLEAGKKADLTIVDFRKPHLTPSYDVVAELTRFTYGSDVDTVIVDGRVLMEDRQVLSMDEAEIMEKAGEIGVSTYDETRHRIPKLVPVNRWPVE